MRRAAGGSPLGGFGRTRAKRVAPEARSVTFRDVAGVDEAVEELHEIKEFLENPKKFQALGARIPKGVLLYGPPGTGKTLLARAVAGEAGVPFFSISGSDFVEMFVGVGASRVRDLFEQAKQNSPCIIFMDEIDAVGRHRGAGLGGGHDEREQTLNQLLVEMDGFEAKDNIIMIAATNRPDILDPALLRPGRFDRQITVDRPDRKGRAKILEVHTRGKPLAKGIDVDTLAGQTPGFTGADLSNLVNEAALLAARTGKKEITHVDLEEGIMRVVAGPEKKTRVMGEKERLITAYHEMGHAIVGHYLEHSDPVHKVSIISRGQALGYTISLPSEDKFLTTRAELLDTMAMTLGGRAAEEIVFHEITTGASNDLEKVTATAKQMVMRFGMSEKLGPRVFGHDHGQPFLGREFSRTASVLAPNGTRNRRRDPPPSRRRDGSREGESCSPIASDLRSMAEALSATRRSTASSSSRSWPARPRPKSSPVRVSADRHGAAPARGRPAVSPRRCDTRRPSARCRPSRPRSPTDRARYRARHTDVPRARRGQGPVGRVHSECMGTQGQIGGDGRFVSTGRCKPSSRMSAVSLSGVHGSTGSTPHSAFFFAAQGGRGRRNLHGGPDGEPRLVGTDCGSCLVWPIAPRRDATPTTSSTTSAATSSRPPRVSRAPCPSLKRHERCRRCSDASRRRSRSSAARAHSAERQRRIAKAIGRATPGRGRPPRAWLHQSERCFAGRPRCNPRGALLAVRRFGGRGHAPDS